MLSVSCLSLLHLLAHWGSSTNQILRMIMYFFIILGLDQADGQRICHKNYLSNRFKI